MNEEFGIKLSEKFNGNKKLVWNEVKERRCRVCVNVTNKGEDGVYVR